jgi:hypothetical protein
LAIDLHSTLQYLPDVATHEQTGCAHFSTFAGVHFFLSTLDQVAHDPSLNISHQDRVCLYGKEHIAKAAACAGGTGLNGAILRILKKTRPHVQVTFIALPWIKVAPRRVWLANCCFAHISLGFPFLLRFCDEQSGHSFYPFPCYPGPLARSWRRPFRSCGVPYPQAPTLDRGSLTAMIAEFMHVGPHPRRLNGTLGTSHSSSPFRNRSEALDTASASQSLEQGKVPHAVLAESPTEARPERSEPRTHPCGRRNEAT